MAVMNSTELPIGSPLPAHVLGDPWGNPHNLVELVGAKGLLVVVTCNHCPYAKAVWPRVIDLAREASNLGVNTVAVNPNFNPEYPDDSPEAMQREIHNRGIEFPYLVDKRQELARVLKATCTPEFYLYDVNRALVYHGRLDDNWKEPHNVTRHDLRDAIIALVEGIPVNPDQHPSMGCSIKWV
jgi:thiol-disulfide isomerase/thioredoxin